MGTPIRSGYQFSSFPGQLSNESISSERCPHLILGLIQLPDILNMIQNLGSVCGAYWPEDGKKNLGVLGLTPSLCQMYPKI